MTKLLEQGIEAVKDPLADRQGLAGELLLCLAQSKAGYSLTAEQIEDLKLSITEADRGAYASDKEVAEIWKKFG